MTHLPFLIILALFSTQPVDLSVSPFASMAPAQVRVRAIVERQDQNRALCLSFDGPEYKRSCLQLDGALAPRVFTAWWTCRIPGDYLALAELTRTEDGKLKAYRMSAPFVVKGFE